MVVTQDDSAALSVSRRVGVKKSLSVVFVIAMLAVGGWFGWQYWQQEEEDELLLAVVQVGDIENTITAAGTLQPRNFVDVGAQVTGLLQRLYVEIGDEVEQGQLLAEIDPRVQQSRVDSSRASLESLEAQVHAREAALTLARANAQRQERLRAADATSELDYDTAMNNLANAEAALIQLQKQIEQSEAGLLQEETQLEFTSIFAPISGTVVSIEIVEGRTINAVQQAPTILRIADLDNMTVATDISEADVSRVQRGMEVYFTTLGSGNRRWYSTVRQIQPTPQVANNVVLYRGLFDVENSDGMLLPEMTAQVYFVTSAARNVLTVPLGALRFEDPSAPASAARGFPAGGGAGPDMAAMRGRAPGMPAAGGGPMVPGKAGEGAATRPQGRLASVTVVNELGQREDRQVMIGITSRVAAEVLSGLRQGEQVVAGILQRNAAATPQAGPPANANFRMMRGF